MTRHERILLLLGSLYDLLPAPHGALRTESGLTPAARRPCPVCGHTDTLGVVTDRFKRTAPCTTCGGREPAPGVRGRKGRGWVAVDPMDALEQPIRTETADAPTRPARVVKCDACEGSGVGGAHLDAEGLEYRDRCRYCDGTGHRAVTSITSDDDARRDDEAIERRANAGSYRELDRALDQLHAAHPRVWAATMSVHVHHTAPEPTAGTYHAQLLRFALVYLDARMPDPIRVPGSVREADRNRAEQLKRIRGRGTSTRALAERDREIRRLARQGKPRPWIASEYGLSVRQVGNVVNGEKEAA